MLSEMHACLGAGLFSHDPAAMNWHGFMPAACTASCRVLCGLRVLPLSPLSPVIALASPSPSSLCRKTCLGGTVVQTVWSEPVLTLLQRLGVVRRGFLSVLKSPSASFSELCLVCCVFVNFHPWGNTHLKGSLAFERSPPHFPILGCWNDQTSI